MMKNRTAAAVVIAIVSIYSIFSASARPLQGSNRRTQTASAEAPRSARGRPTRHISRRQHRLSAQKRHARSEIEAALGQARALDAQGKDEDAPPRSLKRSFCHP